MKNHYAPKRHHNMRLAGHPRTKTQSELLKPLTDEITPYGAKRYRTPYTASQYVGTKGVPMDAVILDIDGTLQDWGEVVAKKVAEFCDRHHKEGHLLVVFTARVHEHEFQRSFDWLVSHLPYPFIGPFCRSRKDPRYASEFKRELAQDMENMGLFRFVGAADDCDEVNDMWKQWAIDHFDNPADFDHLICTYTRYNDWRKTIGGYDWDYGWPGAKHRPAGTSHYGSNPVSSWGKDPVTGTYKDSRYWGKQPQPGDNIADDWAWRDYFVKRERAGAYMGVERALTLDIKEVIDPVLGPEDQAKLEDLLDSEYGLRREDMEEIAAHNDPTLTPEILEAMTDEELREECGITYEDYMEMLYEQVKRKFGFRYTESELDQLGGDEIEQLLTMTRDEADVFIDQITQKPEETELLWSDDPEQNAKIQYRMDLEDDVVANTELSEDEVRRMDAKDLEIILKAARPDDSLSAVDIAEELGHIVFSHADDLPPVGAPTEEGAA